MYCKSCGKRIDDDSRFCKYCGCSMNGEVLLNAGSNKENFVIESGILKKYLGVESHINIPEKVCAIGEEVFKDMTSLKSVKIPSSVTKIGGGAFNGCTSLSSITIPNTVKEIERGAFRGCTSLTEVIIPYGISHLNSCVFAECTSLRKIVIPETVMSITNETGSFYSSSTFWGCSSLTQIIAPARFEYTAFVGSKYYYEKKAELEEEKEKIEKIEKERKRNGLCPRCGTKKPFLGSRCKKCGYIF